MPALPMWYHASVLSNLTARYEGKLGLRLCSCWGAAKPTSNIGLPSIHAMEGGKKFVISSHGHKKKKTHRIKSSAGRI